MLHKYVRTTAFGVCKPGSFTNSYFCASINLVSLRYFNDNQQATQTRRGCYRYQLSVANFG